MAKYHINRHTGNPGICRALKGDCPFGGDDAHYATKDEARVVYEKRMEGLEQARNDSTYAHLEDRPTANSSWNKYRRLVGELSMENYESFADYAEAHEKVMENLGPTELFYLSEKEWPDEKTRPLAKSEMNRRAKKKEKAAGEQLQAAFKQMQENYSKDMAAKSDTNANLDPVPFSTTDEAYGRLTPDEQEALYSHDTLVRDFYWDARGAGLNHEAGMKFANEWDKLTLKNMDNDDFDWQKENDRLLEKYTGVKL